MGAGWWPERAPNAPLDHDAESPAAAEYIFPSGRAAIAQALERFELPRGAAIAIAGYGSDCLARIVRRFGTPVDVCAAEANAAVLYEQWGWPFTGDAWDEVMKRFKARPMVVDRVDSADFFARHVDGLEVVSLSKLLGIAGGGLTRVQGCFEEFEPRPQSAAMRQLRTRPPGTLARAGYQELFKETRQAVHPAVVAWLQRNSLSFAADQECAARQRHLQRMLQSSLSKHWPAWMHEAISSGAGPVWAPILRGQDVGRYWRAMSTLEERFGVISAIRQFNWSGNPMRTQYELCLALPVHSGVNDFDEIVAAVE